MSGEKLLSTTLRPLGWYETVIQGDLLVKLLWREQVRTTSTSRSLGNLGASSVGNGLARIEPEPGTLVVYAAKHGEFAFDGDGKNSPFLEALVRRIEQKPAIEVRRLFDFVRQDVFASTKKQQQPFSYGSLEASDDFFFVR
jgi:hypothetical protein